MFRHPREAGHFERRSRLGRLRLRGAELGRADFPDGRDELIVLRKGDDYKRVVVVVSPQRSRRLRAS